MSKQRQLTLSQAFAKVPKHEQQSLQLAQHEQGLREKADREKLAQEDLISAAEEEELAAAGNADEVQHLLSSGSLPPEPQEAEVTRGGRVRKAVKAADGSDLGWQG